MLLSRWLNTFSSRLRGAHKRCAARSRHGVVRGTSLTSAMCSRLIACPSEQLEDRTLLAFDLSISAAATAGVSTVNSGGNRTFTATAPGANINVADIQAGLVANLNVVISNGSTGVETGNITWNAALDYDGFVGTQSLTINTDASGTSASFELANVSISDSMPGDEILNIFMNVHNGVLLSGADADVVTGGGSFTINADSDSDGTGTFNLDNASGSVSASGGAISITAADASLSGPLAGTSTLQLIPSVASSTIGIGAGSTGTFQLLTSELAQLTDGFSSITIGDATNGTGAVDINSSTFNDPITIVGGSIEVTGLNASSNAVTLTARTGAITDGGSVSADIVGGTVSLVVMNSGDEIGVAGPMGGPSDPLEIDVATLLNASTVDGHITLENVGLHLPLGVLDAGAAMILLTSNFGPITDGNGGIGAANLTAASGVNFTANGFFSAIGTMALPIRTVIGSLSATTNDGGVFISDTNAAGLIINNVLAKEGGFGPIVDTNNHVSVNAAAPHAGIHDVSISAQGPILLNSISAPGALTLSSTTGSILDLNQSATDLLARTVSLIASGAIGQVTDAIEMTAESFSASTTDGGIYLADSLVGTATSVVAGGASNDVNVKSSASSLRLGTITALGNVTVKNDVGSLIDNNGPALNVTGQMVELTGKSGIGTSADPIETTAADLVATASDLAASIYLNETDGLNSVVVKTNDGNVTINFTGGPLTFTASTDVLTASGAPVTFETTGGGIKLGVVDVGSSAVSITAFGSIQDDTIDSMVDVRGGTVTLKAGNGISAVGNEIDTDVVTLNATTTSGVIQIREVDALTLSATTSSGNIDVRNTTGDLTLLTVSTTGQATLHAGGAVLDGNANSNNVSANMLDLSASNGVGSATDALETSVSSLTAPGGLGGGLFLSNSKALNLNSVTATGSVSVATTGNLTVGTVTATGQTVTLSAAGELIDGNGTALNITALSATLNGSKIGTSSDKFETNVETITAATTSGGLYLSDFGTASLTLTATAIGQGADIDIDGAGDIVLKTATAQGDTVKLSAAGKILDGNDTPTTKPVNITANTLDIAAPGGIGTPTNQLEVNVNQVLGADGGAGGGSVANSGPLAIKEEALEKAGSGELVFDAESITILDIADNTATVAAGRSVVFKTQKGNIVFLDPADTIQASGGGSITVQAGLVAGSGAVAVLGNLKTSGGAIIVSADRNITIGLLDAGTGAVSVISKGGVIVDGNGASLNIIGGAATVSGVTPTDRQAELNEINKIADAAGTRGEAAAKQTSFEAFDAGSVILVGAQIAAESAVNGAEDTVSSKQDVFDPLDQTSTDMEIALEVLSGVSFGLDIAVTVAGTIAAVAQAVPFTGDGGSATVAFGIQVAKNVVDATILGLSIAKDKVDGERESALIELTESKAELAAAESTLTLAKATSDAFKESTSIAKAAAEKAAIARDAAARVSDQATLARDQANALGTAAEPLGIQATGPVNITAGQSDIFLQLVGPTALGNVTATGADKQVQVSATGDITIQGTISSPTRVRIDTSSGAIANGGGTITAVEFVATATAGVGTFGPLATKVDKIAISGGSGGVNISNTGNLEVTTIDGVVGVSATAGGVSISIASDLTLTSLVNAPGQTVSLSAGTGQIIDGNGSANNVVADGLALNSITGITSSADVLETTVSKLAANGGSGGVFVSNTGSLTLQTVGAVGSVTASGGRIAIVNSGAIQVADGIVQGAGLIVDLTATGGSITETSPGAAADIVGSTINLIVTGASSTVGTGSQTLEIDAGTLNVTTAGGSIFLDDTAGGVVLGLVDAGTGNVALTATGGSITESNDVATDLVGSTVSLTVTGATSTVGTSSGTLEIDATTLNVTTAGGSVFLRDISDGIAIGLLDASTGNVTLTATGGSITESATPDAAADLVGATINLTVTGATSTVGTSSETLEIDAGTLNVTTAGGSIFLSDTAGGVVLGLVNAGTGNVTLTATGGSITESNDAATDLVGTTLNLTVTGATSTVGTSSGTLEIDAKTLNVTTAGGSVFLRDISGGIAIGLVDASTGDVTLTATGGSITESATTDAAADIVGATINLTVTGATSTVGTSSETLEIDASTLNVTTAGGSVFLKDTAGGVAVGLVTTGGGTVTLDGGTFQTASGGNDILSNTVVASGATLGGTGSVIGSVTVQSGGTVAPGLGVSPGRLNSGSVTFVSGSIFSAEFSGKTTAGTDYDQLNVTGTVDLGGATLSLSALNGFVPAIGDKFTIIANDDDVPRDELIGTFHELPEGGVIKNFLGATGINAVISYRGGTGNDVVLSVIPALVINDVSVVEGNNGLTELTFTVTLANQVSSGFRVDYAVLDGTATFSSKDYSGIRPGLKIGAFDSSRGGTFSLSDGSSASAMRSLIQTTFPGAVLKGTSTLTSEFLAGVDVVWLNSVSSNESAVVPLSSAEQAALRTFVMNGGDALIFGENGAFDDESLLDPFNATTTGTLAGIQSGTITNTTHVLVNGTYGSVATLQGNFPGTFSALGSAVPLGTWNSSGGINAAVIDPNVLGAGSGRVLLLSDVNMYVDQLGSADNSKLLLNALSPHLTFAGTACETHTITVLINGDAINETDETLKVLLSNVHGNAQVILFKDTGLGVILNDESLGNPPVITSNGGGATANVSIPENTVAVLTTVTATDATPGDMLTFSKSGVDAARFVLHPTTHELTFLATPDFENPSDANLDNVYQVVLTVSDLAGNEDTQTLNVKVTDVQSTLSIDDVSQLEMNSGMSNFQFAVTLGSAVAPFSVQYRTQDVTATVANNDYVGMAAGTLRIGAFDGSRGGTFSLSNGSSAAAMKTLIQTSFPGVTITGTSTLTAEFLSTVDVLWLNSVSGNTSATAALTGAEKAALLAFVQNGGHALLFGENVAFDDESLLDPFNATTTGTLTDLQSGTITNTTHSLTAATAPFGAVTTLQGNFPGNLSELGSATALGKWNSGNGTNVAVLDPGVLSANSGRVVLLADVNFYADQLNSADNKKLLLNALASMAPASSMTLPFLGTANETQVIQVSVKGDLKVEGDETFRVLLGQFSGTNDVTIVKGTGLGTIQNDDGGNQPVITSDNGGDTATTSVVENSTAVTTVTATDADLLTPAGDTLTYSISGGADAAKFAIVPVTGVLTFKTAPDFENPSDTDHDNVYQVTVTVTDAVGQSDAQMLSVTVTNVQATLSIGNAQATEGSPLSFPVTLSNAVGTGFKVNYASQDGTGPNAAVAGQDYVPVSTGTLRIGAFDGTRGGIFSLSNGSSVGAMRALITSSFSGVTFVGLSTLTPESLASVDVLWLNSVSSNTSATPALSSNEQNALLAFVQNGGHAMIFGENSAFDDESLLDKFNATTTGTLSEIQAGTITDTSPTNPLTHGTFGTVATLQGNYSGSFNSSNGGLGLATELATWNSGGPTSVAVAVIEPHGALGTNSGRVVLFSDVNFYSDQLNAADNSKLLLNALATMLSPTPLAFTGTQSTPEVRSITVTTNSDAHSEGDETLNVLLGTLSGTNDVTISNATGQGTIHDGAAGQHNVSGVSEGSVSVMINDVLLREGNSGSFKAVFTVQLSEVSDETVTVRYATVNATATSGVDYKSANGTLTFAPGQTTKTFTILVTGDKLAEATEFFDVLFESSDNVDLVRDTARVTIVDNDPIPSLSINSVSMKEGTGSGADAVFTVKLSKASGAPVTVHYSSLDGTAAAGSDYDQTSGTLTFAPGQTTQTVKVHVTGDSLSEANETFQVLLSDATNATIRTSIGKGTIKNDDKAPSLSIGDVTVVEGNIAVFTVILSAPSGQDVTVKYATANGSAKANQDYTAASGTLTFAAGETTKTVSVNVGSTIAGKARKQFAVNLSSPLNAVFADRQALATILDSN